MDSLLRMKGIYEQKWRFLSNYIDKLLEKGKNLDFTVFLGEWA
ncbi:hypothetical protein Cal6303_5218 [Calothrix sp. PCC 6303]|nr:hypothetical protein Cal6303_5218 [Calothrix sp. PCC 6303]